MMVRLLAMGLSLAAASVMFAAPAVAEPCQDSDASDVECALGIAPGEAPSSQADLTSQDMDVYLAGLSAQTADLIEKEEIARLILSGSYAEKMKYLAEHSEGKTLPLIRQDVAPEKGVCKLITKTWCVLSCYDTGSAQEQCYNDCKDILVESCS